MGREIKKVAVLGAGPSGLAALRAFESARQKGKQIPQITCFEKQEDWGGMWNYTWRTGLDQYGEKVHGSMYRYLWSNGPKECLEFADYSFEEHFGKQISSFPPRAVLRDYIIGRVEKNNVRNYIRFLHSIRFVSFDPEKELFNVQVCDLKNDTIFVEQFDAVIVATGHFSTPNVPEFPGFENFLGRILHSHNFRDAVEFKEKDVLIIGASYSAEDIGVQCHKYGAKSVIFSYRTAPMGFKWPKGMEERPLLQRVNGNTAYFKDGSSATIDAIILCTGYLHDLYYMEEPLRLKSKNCVSLPNVYKGIFWIDNPRLIYLGMQDQWFSFNMFDAQAWYARDILMGWTSEKTPSRSEQQKDIDHWIERETKATSASMLIDLQRDYVRDLLNRTDYPPIDIEQAAEMFKMWKGHKAQNILTYRDQIFSSLITGTLAPRHHTSWIEELDDSLETFLNPPQKISSRL